jgi:hypothetical protein
MNPTSARLTDEWTVSRGKIFDGREKGDQKYSPLIQSLRIGMNALSFQKVYRNGVFGSKRVRQTKEIARHFMGNILQMALSGAGYCEIVSSQACFFSNGDDAALRYLNRTFAFPWSR